MSGCSKIVLESEIATYCRELPNLVEQEGKWIVIVGRRIVGIYGCVGEACVAAFNEVGFAPCLMRKIQQTEPVYYSPGAGRYSDINKSGENLAGADSYGSCRLGYGIRCPCLCSVARITSTRSDYNINVGGHRGDD